MARRKSQGDVYQVQVKGERRAGADSYRLRESILRENPGLDPAGVTIKTGNSIPKRPAKG